MALPLGVSFVILALVGRGLSESASLPMLVVLGVWSSVHAAAFLRGRLTAGQPHELTAKSALLAASCFGALALLGALLLFDPHPVTLAGLWGVLSIPVVVLVALAALPGLAAVAGAVSLCGIFAVANAHTDWRLIACAGAWALVYLAGGAWDLLRRRLPATPLRLGVVSGAGLAFVALVLQQTGDA